MILKKKLEGHHSLIKKKKKDIWLDEKQVNKRPDIQHEDLINDKYSHINYTYKPKSKIIYTKLLLHIYVGKLTYLFFSIIHL
jgi:hypothetical protein